MLDPHPIRRRLIETRSGRYRVAWIPLPHSPIPGFTACAVQAVPAVPHPRDAIRLVLYERRSPPPPEDDNGRGAA